MATSGPVQMAFHRCANLSVGKIPDRTAGSKHACFGNWEFRQMIYLRECLLPCVGVIFSKLSLLASLIE